MLRKLLFICCAVPFFCFSQAKKDSLLSVWKNTRLDAGTRIDAIEKAFDFYLPYTPDSALVYGHLALDLARQHKLVKKEANLLHIIGVSFFYAKNFQEALSYYNKSLELSLKINEKQKIARIYRNLGILYFDQGYFKKSLGYFKLSLKYADPESPNYNRALINIGNAYIKVKNYEKAATYARMAINQSKRINNTDVLDSYYTNLADVLIEAGKLAEAEKYLHTALTYATNEEDLNYCEAAFISLYIKQNNFGKAYKLNQKTLQYFIETNDLPMISRAYLQRAKINKAVGDEKKAVIAAEKALYYGNKSQTKLDMYDIYSFLIHLYEKQGNYKKAFELSTLQSVIKDSINGNAIAQFDLSEAFEKKSLKDSLNAVQKNKILDFRYTQKLQTQRIYIWAGIFAAISLLLVLIFIYKNYKNKQKINEIISKENKNLEFQKQLGLNHISELLGVIESARDFIAFSKSEPVFSYINKAGKKMLGVENSNQERFSYEAVFDVETVGFINAVAIPECHANGFFSGEVTIYLPDRTQFPVLLNVVCHRNSDNAITQYSMIARDISDLKDYQVKIEHQNKELRKVNDELDRFVYSTSHDLRAPLTSVTGIVSILQEEFLSDNKDFQMYLEMIQFAINRTDNAIKSILEYSKNSRLLLKIETIDVEVIIDAMLKNFSALLQQQNIQVSVAISGKAEFHNDKMRFEVLLGNLIDNAIKFQEPGNDGKRIEIGFEYGENNNILTISDNGIGIEKSDHERIFDMFFRASSFSSGAGLGLYVVKQISELLHATVFLESDLKKGTKIKIIFPNLESKYTSHENNNAH